MTHWTPQQDFVIYNIVITLYTKIPYNEMSRQQAYSEICQLLFTAYRINTEGVSDIHPIADKHGLSSIQVAMELSSLGVIQRDFLYSFPKLYCAITVLGMYQVDKTLIDRWTRNVIVGLTSDDGKGNMSEYLKDEIGQAQGIVDFARYMVSLGYVSIIASNCPNRVVCCRLTHDGWREANNFT